MRRINLVGISEYFVVGARTYRAKLAVQASFWLSAVAMGITAVYFTRLVEQVQRLYSAGFTEHPVLMTFFTPMAFLAAAAVVKFWAPHAGGSGVPQVLFAVDLARETPEVPVQSGMISLRTAAVKVLSTALGFLGGASIGGEGPTVQIAGSIFGSIGHFMRRYFPKLDLRSYVVAGAGAGIAAAFNTPLGGVAFALEEVAMGDFGPLRHLVILAVIVTGLVAQAIVGDALYFGNPNIAASTLNYVYWAVIIGAAGGIFGGVFGRLASIRVFDKLKMNWWMKALACGVLVALIDALFMGRTGGSGYTVTRFFMEDRPTDLPLSFPIFKLLATALSTLSGMGGGILAPSLSIGGWLGISIGKIVALPQLKVCALLGMVAYFSGAFQIPITATIIVMEMTNEHDIIFPMLVAGLVAYLIGKIIMPESLYHVLIHRMMGSSQKIEEH